MDDQAKEKRADLRAEYAALSGYFTNVVTFRFMTLGFFLAAVGLIVQEGKISREEASLLLLLAIGLWIVELRNRSLYRCIEDRGMQIERECWGYNNEIAYDPFYCCMTKRRHERGMSLKAEEQRPADVSTIRYPWIKVHKKLFWPVTPVFKAVRFRARWASHTLGMDVIYWSVMAYAAYHLFFPDSVTPRSQTGLV